MAPGGACEGLVTDLPRRPGQRPGGVTIVTTLDGTDVAHGMVASSFSSVSLDPPLVSVCVATRLRSHDLIEASGRFGVSVLAKGQIEVARRFGGMAGEVDDRFDGESWTAAEAGVPLHDRARLGSTAPEAPVSPPRASTR